MAEVIRISDNPTLVPTKNYQYASWEFDEFNPCQSSVFNVFDKNANMAIAAATSAGKTIMSEMIAAYEIRKNNGKAIYVGPLKALASEKEQDWTDPSHHFSNLNISIVTGDFRFTAKRSNEVNCSDLIVMTPEMLASKCRNDSSDKSQFLKDVKVVIFDESHLLTVPNRGDHIEVALMKLVKINPDIRIVLLSATMPNVDEICQWITNLTQKDTYFLESNYRPCPLSIHYESYYDGDKSYDDKEDNKIQSAVSIVNYYPNDKFLIFVHTKRTGKLMVKQLDQNGIVAEFHNANLAFKERKNLEDRFKNDVNTRVIVATSTLAWGCYAHGTRLLGPHGRLVNVEDVFEGTNLLCPVENKFEKRTVVSCRDFEDKNGILVILESGEEMLVSSDHVFFGTNKRNIPDWCKANILEKGDFIATPSDLKFKTPTEFMFDPFWYLIGFGFGDGSITDCGTHADGSQKAVLDFCLGTRDRHADQIVAWFNQLFGTNYEMHDDINSIPHLITKKRDIVDKFLDHLPLGRKIGLDDVPSKIYGKAKIVANFLRGWFDADGGMEDHSNDNQSVGLSCISKRALESARALLLGFGIHSSFGKKKVKDVIINGRFQKSTRKYSYRIRIFGNTNISKFSKTIGFGHVEKQQKLNKYLSSISSNKLQKDLIPARSLINEHLNLNNLTKLDFRRICNSDLWNCVNKSDCNRFTLQKLINNTSKRSGLNDLVEKPIFWSRIKSIKKKIHGTFREIEIDDPFAYVGNGAISHNCNLPARRVIVTGIHRGLQLVENYDIWQMVGRAGRPKYDPRGDAYILVPESNKNEHIGRLKKQSPIRSTMLEYVGTDANPHYKTLAFHVVSEIHHGSIKTKEGFHQWFRKSLAHHQDQNFNDAVIDRTIKMLEQCRAIVVEDGEYKCTAVGKVASMFYYSPFDVSDLRRNFKQVFDQKLEENDYALAMAMGNVDTNKWAIANRYEKEQMATFQGKVERMFGESTFLPGAIKYGFVYFNMLKGKKNDVFAALQGAMLVDLERTMQVINALDNMSCKWEKQNWFKTFKMRLQYGVEADLVELVQIPNVGHVRANRLKDKKIKSLGDFLNYDVGTIAKIMKCSTKLAEEALEGARLIEFKGSIND